eukprot:EG_transcript_37371
MATGGNGCVWSFYGRYGAGMSGVHRRLAVTIVVRDNGGGLSGARPFSDANGPSIALPVCSADFFRSKVFHKRHFDRMSGQASTESRQQRCAVEVRSGPIKFQH